MKVSPLKAIRERFQKPYKNIARIANAVQCHNQLSGNKDCHEFGFSIVRIVISGSIITSLQDCLVLQKTILQTCDNRDTDYNSQT